MYASANFDDMPNDLEGGPLPPLAEPKPPVYIEMCQRCRGTGSVAWGVCFRCNGKGSQVFKNPAPVRAKAREQAAVRKDKMIKLSWEAWQEKHPAEAAWIEAKKDTFGFAESMWNAVRSYFDLSERQMAAVQRCMANDAARENDRQARAMAAKAAAPQVTIEKIEAAFGKALAAGIKRPKLRLAEFVFKPAKPTGVNPGAIYVTEAESGTYLGKVMGGLFLKSRDCADQQDAEICAVASDPEAAAVAYGKKFGQCAVCARELSDPVSVERGIGPICAERMGW